MVDVADLRAELENDVATSRPIKAFVDVPSSDEGDASVIRRLSARFPITAPFGNS
ncbi:MAG: hypothetical protein ACRDLB_05425 [Actinomycetota bacterium]